MQVAEGGKGIEEDKTGTEPDGGGGGVSAKGGCGDYRGRGCGGGGDGGLGEDGVPEKRVRRDIGAWKGAVVVIVVVGVVVLVMVADGDPLTTLIMVTQVKVVGKEEIRVGRSSS